MPGSFRILDGKVHIYRRPNSRYWQCSVYLGGRNYRQSTHHEALDPAIQFAREWALDRMAEERLCGAEQSVRLWGRDLPAVLPKARSSRPEKRFRHAASEFLNEFEALTRGERNPRYVASKARILRLYLLPFFGDLPLLEVTAGRVQAYRLWRLTPQDSRNEGIRRGPPQLMARRRPPSRSTLHAEIVCLRQVLKTANRKGWLPALPGLSAAYKASGKVGRRAWFSPAEFRRLCEATLARAKQPRAERWRRACETLHDYVRFMAHTGLRPDEASRLEFRDVEIVREPATFQRILELEVRGKRGVGFCISLPGAVRPFERQRRRIGGHPNDLVFGPVQRELLNTILEELGLKRDRDGNPRTAYSLRHTYICERLMAGADIYQLAKNCRTSVGMIERFYAVHLKNSIDASRVNLRAARKPGRP